MTKASEFFGKNGKLSNFRSKCVVMNFS